MLNGRHLSPHIQSVRVCEPLGREVPSRGAARPAEKNLPHVCRYDVSPARLVPPHAVIPHGPEPMVERVGHVPGVVAGNAYVDPLPVDPELRRGGPPGLAVQLGYLSNAPQDYVHIPPLVGLGGGRRRWMDGPLGDPLGRLPLGLLDAPPHAPPHMEAGPYTY